MQCEPTSLVLLNSLAATGGVFGLPAAEEPDEPGGAPGTGPNPRTGRPASILIVEDEGLVALSISQTLSDAGYDVVGVAASADAAVRAAESRTPDLVLMDIALRGRKDGIEAARMLKSRHDLDILFVTAHGDPQTRSRAQVVNPAGFLIKPYDGGQLLKAVRQALPSRE